MDDTPVIVLDVASDGPVREIFVGDRVFLFDGRVLEVLNGDGGSLRVHVAQMKLEVKPTWRDRLFVEITSARRNTPRDNFEVMPEDRPALEALVAEVEEARAMLAAERGTPLD